MAGFVLSENPFCVLRVSPRASVREIEDAFEDAVVDRPADEQTLLRVKQELLTPNARLGAELSWLSEIAPRRASDVLNRLLTGDTAAVETSLADMPPLTGANVAADALQRFGDPKFLAPLVSAHRGIRVANLAEGINSTRSAAGFGKVEAEMVSAGLRKLRTQHAAAAVRGLVASGRAPQELTALLAEFPDAHDPLLREVVREFDQWSSPHLAEISEDIDRALADVAAGDEGAVEALCQKLQAWDDLSQPAQVFAQFSGLDEERSLKIYKKVRSACIDLANEQARYGDAQQIAADMRSLFRELPTAAAELDVDLVTLAGLIDQAELAKAVEPLRAAISSARENVRELAADLVRFGFGDGRGGVVLKELHVAFLGAVSALARTNDADLPLGMMRSLAIDLNNEDNEPTAALALSEGLLRSAKPVSQELASQLETDIRIGKNNEAFARLTAAVSAKRLKEASAIVAAMLAGPNEAEARSNLRLIQESIQQQRNRRVISTVGWSVAALFVLFLIVQNSGSGPSTTATTPYVTDAAASAQSAAAAEASQSAAAAAAADAAATTSQQATTAGDGTISGSETPTSGAPVAEPRSLATNVAEPPVGTGLSLEPAQIRYCVFEKARLSEMQNLISSNNSGVVARFNTRVEDYNSRCGNFRYRSGDLEAANALAASEAPRLKAEAQVTLQEWGQ